MTSGFASTFLAALIGGTLAEESCATSLLQVRLGLSVAESVSELDQTYLAFLQEHGDTALRSQTVGDTRYESRKTLFQQRLAEVQQQNAQAGASWKAAVNKFADYTDQEFRGLLGHVSGLDDFAGDGSLLQLGPALAIDGGRRDDDREEDERLDAGATDWVPRTPQSTSDSYMRDQGSCGSCWAVSAVAALEMHTELQHNSTPRFSTQQVIDCTPNPQQCGGTGGCKGATALLALQHIQEKGISLDAEYPSSWNKQEEACSEDARPRAARIASFIKVRRNTAGSLLRAVVNGPVLVSVVGSTWNIYDSGVFSGCDADAEINHSVIIVAYGKDGESGKKYWKIRNSWGSNWGEGGYMRLLRHGVNDEDQHCGTDSKPLNGFGCKGGPTSIPVCGMCGIQSNPSYPGKVTFEP